MRNLVVLGAVLATFSCTENSAPVTAPQRTIATSGTVVVAVAPAVDTLHAIKDTLRMQASVTVGGAPDPNATVTWTSLDAFATVSASGLVTAVANGTARIVGSSQGSADTALITVRQVAASGAVQRDTILTLDSAQAVVTWKDSNKVAMQGVSATYASSNTAVVTIDGSGMMRSGIAAGTVTITATATEGGATADGFVTVARRTQPLARFVRLHVGTWRTCGRDDVGDLYCWGKPYLGDAGYPASSVPVMAVPDADYKAFDTGGDATCGVTFTDTMRCWGDSQMGATALPDTALRPTATAGGHQWKAVVSAESSTCATTQADVLLCWGDNRHLQANAGGATSTRTPTRVGASSTWRDVDVGGDHGCGLHFDRRAFCWGRGDDHRLGTEILTENTATPVAVRGNRSYSQIAVGTEHACALHTGQAWCWGQNTYGQLGNGTQAATFAPVLAAGGALFSSISAGGYTTCGILQASGTAMCWGFNGSGQLGIGTAGGFRTTANDVAFGFTWASIDVGSTTTCGVTTAGYAYCWGNNQYGQVGDGTTTQRASPTFVSGQKP